MTLFQNQHNTLTMIVRQSGIRVTIQHLYHQERCTESLCCIENDTGLLCIACEVTHEELQTTEKFSSVPSCVTLCDIKVIHALYALFDSIVLKF